MLNCSNSFLFGMTVKNLENTEKLKKTIIMGTCKISIIRAKTDVLKGKLPVFYKNRNSTG